jgi:hypothetical protein
MDNGGHSNGGGFIVTFFGKLIRKIRKVGHKDHESGGNDGTRKTSLPYSGGGGTSSRSKKWSGPGEDSYHETMSRVSVDDSSRKSRTRLGWGTNSIMDGSSSYAMSASSAGGVIQYNRHGSSSRVSSISSFAFQAESRSVFTSGYVDR